MCHSFRATLAASLILIVCTAWWLSGSESPSPSISTSAAIAKAESPDPARKPEKPPALPQPPAPAAARLDSEETWELDPHGQPISITLALDEAVLRDADGKETFVRLSPPATRATLPARLAALSAPGGVFPVAYLAGEERSTATRRLVTPDLRVQLDAESADKIAATNQLVIKDRPTYAPGWVVMSAADAFAALDAMANLRDHREVVSADVLLAVQHSPRTLPNDTLIGQQWHLKRSGTAASGTDVNIETIWNYPNAGSRGTGIRIGIVDDGLQTAHPDLSANVDTVNDRDWNGNDTDPNPGSGDDHGTACAGNAAARGNNSLGVSGTAPEATLVGMRLIAAAVTDAQEAQAMAHMPDLIEIKSNSWGPDDTGNILEAPGPLTLAALQSATSTGRNGKGSLFLWAAGNGGDVADNSNYDGYANSIHTIAIGAIDSDGSRSFYSERGSNLVVCAPSDGGALGITTTDRSGSLGYNTSSSASGDYTADFGGTSSATPTAAGIVALVLERNPSLGWRDVQEILIRSATKFSPTDGDWANNAAGIPFNHNFGAGLINATAAVNLAATWTNLAAATTATVTQTGFSATIPENNATGLTRTFDLTTSNVRVEHATLRLSVSHTSRGNLEITLTSPSGMASNLAEVHSDTGDNFSNWTFSSVRHWGEISTGTWTLKIADRSGSGNTTGGTVTAAELIIHGAPAAAVNPAPLARITQPVAGQILSPGIPVTVVVNASDLTTAGTPGTVAQVQLFANNLPIATDTTAPYSFTFSPPVGSHTLHATATDDEGATGTSASVTISVANQSPVITAAALSVTGQSFSDEILTVQTITASDPEGGLLSYSYQWESSVNQTVFNAEPAATTNTAPAFPGKLWRCVVTASDGSSASAPFTTAAVNLLDRPATVAITGTPYSYTSGLVLRDTGSTLSRQVILHEFSQGPSGGTAEWIEILTLKAGSLAGWSLQDAAGNLIFFLDDPVWDNIPAGTLIVIYNGASKDPLLPADDLDPAEGRMIVSSTHPACFDPFFDPWLPLGNSGDSIFLQDENFEVVHSIAFGNSIAATPNVGSVGSASSAHFIGESDAAADLATNWKATTALTARSRALLPGVTLTGGTYSQDFNVVPGPDGTTYPDGWTSYSGSTADAVMTVGTGTSTTNGNYNYGSRIGLLGSVSGFDPSSLVLALKNTTGLSGIRISYDIVKIREDARSMNFTLQYSTTSAPAGFTDVPGGSYTSGSVIAGTVTPFTQIALPAALENSDTPVFLRWYYATASGSGARDGIALDHVVISTGTASPALSLAFSPTTFPENLGSPAATGSVSIPAVLEIPLTVQLVSFDTSEVTVPASVVIPAGQTSVTFPVTAVDDLDPDGPQLVAITASATGHSNSNANVTVTDNEVSQEGVTPATANTPTNQSFVSALRNGSLNAPPLFRIGSGASLPVGLVLDPATGTLSGTPSPENPPGDYLIVIERYNNLGEMVSQSYTLTLRSGNPEENSYASWISSFSVGQLTGIADDFDGDGIPNGIENHFGTAPDSASVGLTQVSAAASTLIFRHSRSNSPATDIVVSYEWSFDLVQWQPSATNHGNTTVTFDAATLIDRTAPANDLVEVTATRTGTSAPRIFVRLKAASP